MCLLLSSDPGFESESMMTPWGCRAGGCVRVWAMTGWRWGTGTCLCRWFHSLWERKQTETHVLFHVETARWGCTSLASRGGCCSTPGFITSQTANKLKEEQQKHTGKGHNVVIMTWGVIPTDRTNERNYSIHSLHQPVDSNKHRPVGSASQQACNYFIKDLMVVECSSSGLLAGFITTAKRSCVQPIHCQEAWRGTQVEWG